MSDALISSDLDWLSVSISQKNDKNANKKERIT